MVIRVDDEEAEGDYARVASEMPFIDGTLAYKIYRETESHPTGHGRDGRPESSNCPYCSEPSRNELRDTETAPTPALGGAERVAGVPMPAHGS